ncbi:MAG: hypothetical protein RL686_1013, partial [Pseudomonadota bacterium]
MLVAQVELDGVWSVSGGMFEVAKALAQVGEKWGVKPRYGQACARILTQNGQVSGVQLESGEMLEADHVIFNGDVAALAQGLLGSAVQPSFAKVPALHRSLSAFTLSMHAESSGFPMVRHNVFFNQNYQREFDDIFQHRRLPEQGTVYV